MEIEVWNEFADRLGCLFASALGLRLAKTSAFIDSVRLQTPGFFIEEPVAGAGKPAWQYHPAAKNLTVCRLQSPAQTSGFADTQLEVLRSQLELLLAEHKIDEAIAWFYTPMAVPLLDAVPYRAVVYDCMDELSAFHGAPPSMLAREADLLKAADVVFTGGPSLYQAKKDRHANVHCFPSSVDAGHFRQAQQGIAQAPNQVDLPYPRLGYFGVIDERFDAQLLGTLAQARPLWQFIVVGAVVKIDPASLPRNPNIHYFGQRSYQELPYYLAGWDVCLLPFARNESTRFISPTKTLEYMAAERPIVSTPITDVAKPYSDIVYIGDTPEKFLMACEQALGASPEERDARTARMREVLVNTSWEATAGAIDSLMQKVIDERHDNHSPTKTALSRNDRAAGKRTPPVVVIGAGPTGLSAAYHLGKEALLLERNSQVGGWCRSIHESGFTFDFAGHIMFSNDPYVHDMYKVLLGANVHWQDREAWI